MDQTNISSAKPGWMDEVTVGYEYANGTTDVTSPENESHPIYEVVMLIIIVLGIVGNLLTIIVLSQPRNRNSSTAVLYICLAVSDLVIIITFPMSDWIRTVFDFDPWKQINVCNVVEFISRTFWENSSWIVVIITLTRVVSVSLPFRAKSICRPRNALLVSMGVLILFLCCNVIELYGQNGQCDNLSDAYRKYYDQYRIYKTILLVGLVPAIIIVCGNVVIYRKMRRHPTALEKSREGVLAVTRTLVLVTGVFLVTQLPILTYFCITQVGLAPAMDDWKYSLDLLCDMNAATNFIIYMLQGSRFRSEIRRMFVCQSNDATSF